LLVLVLLLVGALGFIWKPYQEKEQERQTKGKAIRRPRQRDANVERETGQRKWRA
jgi:hypothetical protein